MGFLLTKKAANKSRIITLDISLKTAPLINFNTDSRGVLLYVTRFLKSNMLLNGVTFCYFWAKNSLFWHPLNWFKTLFNNAFEVIGNMLLGMYKKPRLGGFYITYPIKSNTRGITIYIQCYCYFLLRLYKQTISMVKKKRMINRPSLKQGMVRS